MLRNKCPSELSSGGFFAPIFKNKLAPQGEILYNIQNQGSLAERELAPKATEGLLSQICDCPMSPTAPSFPSCRKRRGRKGALGYGLVRSASEFRQAPIFQASFHTIVTLRVSDYAPPDTREPGLRAVAFEYLQSIEGAGRICWSAPFCGEGLCSASTERTPKASPHRGRQRGAPHLKGSPPRGAFDASCNTPLLFAAASCKIDIILRFLNGNQEDHHAVD